MKIKVDRFGVIACAEHRCTAASTRWGLVVTGLALVVGIFVAGVPIAHGQRPRAPQLLPENTVAYVRIEQTSELFQQLADTALGRLLQDPQVQPFAKHLYESAVGAFRGIESELSLSIEQLKSIPEGEICLALVAPERGTPALVALVEMDQQIANARKIVQYLQNKMEERGDAKSDEKFGDTNLTILTRGGEPVRQTVFFEYEQRIVVTSDLELAKELLSVCDGEGGGITLKDNAEFNAIMNRCSGTGSEQPQMTYYVNPLGFLKSVASENIAFQVVLITLGRVGLDGLRGMGGSLLLGGDQFESLHHTHILLDAPRAGVLEVLAPKSGDVTPEPWAPSDAVTYTTLHWDLRRGYSALAAAYDVARGKDAWDKAVRIPFGERLGVDLEKDVLPSLDGRITRISWTDTAQLAGRAATVTGLKLKDSGAFRSKLQKAVRHAPNQFAKRFTTGFTWYHYSPGATQQAGGSAVGIPNDTCVAIVGDYLLLVGSEALLERVFDTKRGESPPLGDELDFKICASKIRSLPGGNEPVMISFERPEYSFRTSYMLLQSEETRQRLSEFSGQNRFLDALHEALTKHPLPPFHVVAKYFAFSGRLVTSDDAGIHSMGFTFRRD